MRQSGILAAAALHALDHHVDRLAEDHANARALARTFDEIPGFSAAPPETNIVLVQPDGRGADNAELLSFLEKRRILMLKFGESRLRAVTHLDVDRAGITRVGNALAEWIAQRGRAP
jgi:threonine aldolase